MTSPGSSVLSLTPTHQGQQPDERTPLLGRHAASRGSSQKGGPKSSASKLWRRVVGAPDPEEIRSVCDTYTGMSTEEKTDFVVSLL
jgi:hypothetical protein